MNKTWTLEVKEDPKNGDAILEFPDDLMQQAGWKEGDTLDWIDNKDGSWTLKKKEPTQFVLVECVSTFRQRYMIEVPVGIAPPNDTYWELDTASNLKDILATYNKNIAINNAALEEAARLVPKSGYDRSKLYIVPTYGEYESNTQLSGKYNQPAPPVSVVADNAGSPGTTPTPTLGTVTFVRSPLYKNPSPAIRVPKAAIQSIWDMTADMGYEKLDPFNTVSIEKITLAPTKIGSGSGPVTGDKLLSVLSLI